MNGGTLSLHIDINAPKGNHDRILAQVTKVVAKLFIFVESLGIDLCRFIKAYICNALQSS